MNFNTYPDREMLAIALADKMASELEKGLLTHETVSLAVPGGTSPGPIFDNLCAVSTIDWSRVRVMLTDERWVPESSDRSNGKLIKERLMVGPAAKAQFVPFFVEGQTPDQAAGPLSENLAPNFPITLLLLGMGADMHTASLFPGSDGLAAGLDPNAPALVPIRAEGQEPRISLSAPALKGALSTHLVIYGQDKRDALQRAATLPLEQAPIATVLPDATIHWAE